MGFVSSVTKRVIIGTVCAGGAALLGKSIYDAVKKSESKVETVDPETGAKKKVTPEQAGEWKKQMEEAEAPDESNADSGTKEVTEETGADSFAEEVSEETDDNKEE